MTHCICCVGLLSLVTICEALGYRSNTPYQWSSSRRCLFCWDWVLFINQWKIIRKIRLLVWRAKLNFQKQTWLVNLHYIIQIQLKFNSNSTSPLNDSINIREGHFLNPTIRLDLSGVKVSFYHHSTALSVFHAFWSLQWCKICKILKYILYFHASCNITDNAHFHNIHRRFYKSLWLLIGKILYSFFIPWLKSTEWFVKSNPFGTCRGFRI